VGNNSCQGTSSCITYNGDIPDNCYSLVDLRNGVCDEIIPEGGSCAGSFKKCDVGLTCENNICTTPP